MSRRRPIALLLTVAAVALAGCGAQDEEAPGTAVGGVGPTTTAAGSSSTGDPEVDADIKKLTSGAKELFDRQSADVPRATIRSWPAKFCRLQIGMTRAEVLRIMGAATDTTTYSRGPEVSWYGPDVAVTASFEDGRVFLLEDVTGMSGLPCAGSRGRDA